MQTAKSLLTLLALGLCVVSFSQTKPDTEAQAKAREALRKKIAELEGQPAPAPRAVPGAVFATTPATAAGASQATPEQIERLREATRQKIAELNAQGKTAPPTAVAETPTKSAAERRAEEKSAAEEQRRLAAEEKARQKAEAEEAKARERAAAEEAKALEAKAKAEAKAEAKAKPAPPTFEPIPAPALSIPAAKETRLADLLKRYKADEITPLEYHTERAKILAEP